MEPRDPRGHQILAIQALADEKAAIIDEQFKNLKKYIYDDSDTQSVKSRAQHRAMEMIHDRLSIGRQGVPDYKN